MKPLQWVAVGYLLTALFARVHGVDLLPDPLGWAFIFLGTSRLPASGVDGTLRSLAALAGLVSLALWLPPVTDALDRADPSLAWAADLPALTFGALLGHHLTMLAREAGEPVAPHVYRALVSASVIVAALPVLVFGGGLTSWGPPADAAGQLLRLAFVVVMLSWSSSAWAGAMIAQTRTQNPRNS